MRIFIVILLGFIAHLGLSQPLSSEAKFSLITCDAGSEVYSLHGHSAMRVQDPASNLDKVFNWGMFDPGESQVEFTIMFAQGKLDYFLDVQPADYFLFEYKVSERSVRQIELNLTGDQKTKLWQLLLDNDTPANRMYRYDFFFDNCATKIRNILEEIYGESFQWAKHKDAGELTFRNTIDVGLESQPWSDFGIDLGLGSKIDRRASNAELLFLPFYLEEAVLASKIGDQKIAKSQELILDFPKHTTESSVINNPTFVFWTIMIIAALLVFFKLDLASRIFDGFFMTLMAIAGFIILFLWFGTEHTTTDSNYNIIWANPVHLIIPLLMVFKKFRKKLHKLFLVLAIFYFAFFLFWILFPQEFNSAAKPLILAIGIRYYYWFTRTKSVPDVT
ncbi:MAG: hypothetical protein ACI9J3_000311 [Parvicellaceae bacterium]